MTRQEKLKQIGNMHLSAYTSKFIIPVPHRFYENDISIFKDIEKSNWEIVNKHKEIKDYFGVGGHLKEGARRVGAFSIQAYIYNNMIPKIDYVPKESFFNDSKTLLLNRKFENKKVKLRSLFDKKYSFFLRDIDVWIFEEHISFFVLNIEFDDSSKYTINELNEFNNIFRNFKSLKLTEENDFINLKETNKIRDGEQHSFIEYLLELTEIQTIEKMTSRGEEIVKKSFLNIDKCDCTNQYKSKIINDLYSIYHTSTNAKLLVGMQTSTIYYEDEDHTYIKIEEDIEECISNKHVKEMSILSEIPFYLATCTSFTPEKSWTANDDYIYQLVNEGGLNIWKYSAGITIHDSSAFIGLGNDGGSVVGNVNGPFYFIYMLNLYINFQIRYIEHNIIDDNFESKEINYWYKKLQKLKNQFVSDQIGIKFQENEVNKSMSSALKTHELLSEVSSNLVETKSITASNFGIYMTLVGFIFVYLLDKPIKNIFSSYGTYLIVPGLIVGLILYINRIKIRKRFKL